MTTEEKTAEKTTIAPENGTGTMIDISEVPSLYNKQILAWHKNNFDAQKELYNVLTDILEELKQTRKEAKTRNAKSNKKKV